LVGLALVLVVPMSFLAMHRWLQGFAYHTSMGVWVYLAAGVTALAIAFVAVSSQVARAARVDPVNCLRYE
jgi:putative ABC transport system permease protein